VSSAIILEGQGDEDEEAETDITRKLNKSEILVFSVVKAIKTRLTYDINSINFQKEIILLNLEAELHNLYIKFLEKDKEIDFFLNLEKIISKVFSEN